MNFDQFVNDISPKPEGNYFLVRLCDGPYGPQNFKWQEHLKRKPGESKKDWRARKWQARHSGNRSLERRRDLKRKYGISLEEYQEMVSNQNNRCAICGNLESSVDPKNGATKSLSLDHCHATKKVRGLLCWRCNAVLGKMEENPELLEAMIEYIKFHKGN